MYFVAQFSILTDSGTPSVCDIADVYKRDVPICKLVPGCAAMYILDPTVGSGHATPVPWIGLLKYRQELKSQEAVAGVVLINDCTVLINAREVASVNKMQLREAAKVMFLRADNRYWYCAVKDCILHPEFDVYTLNTIALLVLNCEDKLKVEHLYWPSTMTEMEDIFAVGYTDVRKALEQMAYRMKTVNFTDCVDFYSREELDYKWIIPSHYHCYRAEYHPEQCVFDSGMALVTNSSGKWTLIGISTWGPGCGLPSRFIDIQYYVPWIEQHTSIFRRRWLYGEPHTYNKLFLYEEGPKKDLDKYILERINDNHMVMRPISGRETAEGMCWKKDGYLMYREFGTLKVPHVGLGVYGLSMYDLHYAKITCLSIRVTCTRRSVTKFWVTKGFEQEGFLQEFIKKVPIVLWRGTVPPRIQSVSEKWSKYDLIDVNNLMFRFEFYQEATIHIKYYANFTPTVTPKTTTPKATLRTQRPHSTRFYYYAFQSKQWKVQRNETQDNG